MTTYVHVCLQKNRMCLYMGCALAWWCFRVGGQFWGCSHSLTGLHDCCTMRTSGHAALYHAVSKNTDWRTHIHPHLRPAQTLSKETVRKHTVTLHACCCLWPIPASVDFTGSFTPMCHASPHFKVSEHWLFVQPQRYMGRAGYHTHHRVHLHFRIPLSLMEYC